MKKKEVDVHKYPDNWPTGTCINQWLQDNPAWRIAAHGISRLRAERGGSRLVIYESLLISVVESMS